MFDAVNEMAVLGTTLFMMAVATVWFSPMMFGKIWLRELGVTEAEVEDTKEDMWRSLIATFVGYGAMLTILSFTTTYAPFFEMKPLHVAVTVAVFVIALKLTSMVWENRSFVYFMISAGFYSFFIVVGTLMLEYWPW